MGKQRHHAVLSPDKERELYEATLENQGYDRNTINTLRESQFETLQELQPDENLGITGDEYEIPHYDIEGGFFSDLGVGFYNAFVDLAEGAADLIPMAFQAAGSDNEMWDKWINSVDKFMDDRKMIHGTAASQPLMNDLSNLSSWGAAIGQGLGFIASMAGGGTAIGGVLKTAGMAGKPMTAARLGNFVSGTLSMTPAIYEEAIENGIDKNNAARLALGISGLVSLTEGAALEWMGKTISKPVSSKAARESLKETLSKLNTKNITRESLEDGIALTGLKFGERMKSLGPAAFENMAVESTQEFAQTYIEEGIKEIYDTYWSKEGSSKGKGQFGADVMSWETFNEALGGGLVGGLIGGALTVAGSYKNGIKGETLFKYVDSALKNNDLKKMRDLGSMINQLHQEGKLQEQPEAIKAHVDKLIRFSNETKGLNVKDSIARYQLFQMMDLSDEIDQKLQEQFKFTDDTHPLVAEAYKKNEKLASKISEYFNADMKQLIERKEPLDKNKQRFESRLNGYVGLYKAVIKGKADEEFIEKNLPKVSYTARAEAKAKAKAEQQTAQAENKEQTVNQQQTQTTVNDDQSVNVSGENSAPKTGNQNITVEGQEEKGSGTVQTASDEKTTQVEQPQPKNEFESLTDEEIQTQITELESEIKNQKTPDLFKVNNQINQLNKLKQERENRIAKIKTKETVTEQPVLDQTNLDENIGNKVNYRGSVGVIKKENDGTYIVESDNKIYELGKDGSKKLSDLKISKTETPVRKKEYDVKVDNENEVTIKGEKYKINTDSKGNIISLQNNKRTIRNEQALIDAEIQRNRLTINKEVENKTEEQVHTELKESHEIEDVEISAIDTLLDENLNDEIAEVLNNGLSDNVTPALLHKLELYIDNAVRNLENNFQSEYANAIKESLIELQKQIDNEYDSKFEEPVNVKDKVFSAEKNESKERESAEQQSEEEVEEEISAVPESLEQEENDDDFNDLDLDDDFSHSGDESPKSKDQRKSNPIKAAESIMANKSLYYKIKDHFAKIFPHIPVTEISKLAWKYGPDVLARISQLGIEINRDTANQRSLIHEYAHVYIDVLGHNNPIIKSGLEFIKNTPYMKWAKENYPELSEQEQAIEALAEALAQDTLDKLKVRFEGNQLEKFIAWAKMFWNKIKSYFSADKSKHIVSIISDGMAYGKLPVSRNSAILSSMNYNQKQDVKIPAALQLVNAAMVKENLKAIVDKVPATLESINTVYQNALLNRYVDEKRNNVKDASTKIFDGIYDENILKHFDNKQYETAYGLLKIILNEKNPDLSKILDNARKSFLMKNVVSKSRSNEDEIIGDADDKMKGTNAVKQVKKVSQSVRSIITSIIDEKGQLTNPNKVYQYITNVTKVATTHKEFMDKLEKDATLGVNPDAKRLYDLLSNLDEDTKRGIITDLLSLEIDSFYSLNFTGKENEDGEIEEIDIRSQEVNVDEVLKQKMNEIFRDIDMSDNDQALTILSDINPDQLIKEQLDFNVNIQIKNLFDTLLNENINQDVIDNFINQLRSKNIYGLKNFLFGSKFNKVNLKSILEHETDEDGKEQSIKYFSTYLTNIIKENQGEENVQPNFVNKSGNRMSAVRYGDWITQFNKLFKNVKTYTQKYLNTNLYKDNLVLKYWKDNKIKMFIHDTISNGIMNKQTNYSNQSIKDTEILNFYRFTDSASGKDYYNQSLGVTADRDKSTWFKVKRISNDNLAKEYRIKADHDQKIYDEKIAKSPENAKKITAFYNLMSINKIVDGKIVTPFENNYPEYARINLNSIKSELKESLLKTNNESKLNSFYSNKGYNSLDEAIDGFVYNDALNRRYLMDIYVGNPFNLKDVADIVKRLGGSNSNGKLHPIDKPVKVFVIRSKGKKINDVNSDSFSINGTYLHERIAYVSGPTDVVGTNIKDQLFQVDENGTLQYFKMSSVGNYKGALKNMGENYLRFSSAIESIENAIGDNPYIKIIDEKAIKGPKDGYTIIDADEFLNLANNNVEELINKGKDMNFDNYRIAFNLNKDLSKVPLSEQTATLSTQLSTLALNYTDEETIKAFQDSIVDLLKKEIGVKNDDYTSSTLYNNLIDNQKLSVALTKNIDEDEKNMISQILLSIKEHNTAKDANGKLLFDPITSFDHPNLKAIVQQFISSKLTKTGIRTEVAGNYLHMIPNYGSDLNWYETNKDGTLKKPADVALPWSMFASSLERANELLQTNPELFKVVCVRVPASGPVSTFVGQVKYFTDGKTNTVIVPDEFIGISDADHDADKLFVYRQDLTEDSQVKKDSAKTKIFNKLYERISSKEMVEGTKKNLDLEELKNQLIEMGYDNVAGFSTADFNSIAKIQDQMSFGANAIGIMAVASKMLSILSQSNEKLKEPLYFKYENGTIKDTEKLLEFKNKSLHDMAILLQAALDLAKDPFLSSTGINKHTINVATTLSLLGVDIKEIAQFLNDPAIVELTKLIDDNKSAFNSKKPKTVTQIVDEYKKGISFKEHPVLKTADKMNEWLSKQNKIALVNDKMRKEYSPENIYEAKGLKEQPSIYYQLINPVTTGSGTVYEIKVLENAPNTAPLVMRKFEEIEKIAQDIVKVIPIIQLDNSLPNNGTDLRKLNESIKAVKDDSLSITMDNFIKRPLISHYIKTSELLSNVFKRKFITESELYRNVVDKIQQLFKNQDAAKLTDDVFYHTISQQLLINKDINPDYLIDEITNIVNSTSGKLPITGDVNFDYEMHKMYKTLQSDKYTPEEKDFILKNQYEIYGEEAVNNFIERSNEMDKYLPLKNNKFMKYLEVRPLNNKEGSRMVVYPKKSLFAMETDSVKNEVRNDFKNLPENIQNLFIDYQLLRFGINDKINSLMEMLPQEYNTKYLELMSNINKNKSDWFEKNEFSLFCNVVLANANKLKEYKVKINPNTGYATLVKEHKNPPLAIAVNEIPYVLINQEYVPLTIAGYQNGEGFVKYGNANELYKDENEDVINELNKC